MINTTEVFVNYSKFNEMQSELSSAFSNQIDNRFNKRSHLWADIFSNRNAANNLSDFLIAFNEKNTLSYGVTGNLPIAKRNAFIEYYKLLVEKKWLEMFPMSWLGSPSVLDFDGYPVNVNHLQNLQLFTEIKAMLDNVSGLPPALRIVEIGAGYGGVAYFLLKSGIAKSYTIIDLPENLKLSSFFLTQNFKDKSYYIASSPEPCCPTKNIGLTFVPPGNIDSIKEWSFDLAINSDSLGEMPAETAKAYIQWIHEHLAEQGCFFTKNGHNRGKDGVQFPHEYGYQNFEFKTLRPLAAISNLFDDFSHNALLQKIENYINPYPSFYLDSICALYAVGLQGEMIRISEAFSRNEMNEEEKIFLDVCHKFFAKKELKEKLLCLESHIFYNDYAVCVTYLKGITQFLMGNLEESILHLSEYLMKSQSFIAEAYALMILAYKDPKILNTKYKHGAKTRYAIDEILIYHKFSFFKKAMALKLRADILKKKINYPGNYSPSLLIKIKNIIFNFKERRTLSIVRNVSIESKS